MSKKVYLKLLTSGMKNKNFFSVNLDFIGFSASIVCALHCAALPFILLLSSISSLGWLENPLLENGILLLGIIVAICSLLPGYYKKHHKLTPILLTIAGFLMIASGKLLDQIYMEGILTAIGATLVASAHYTNWKLARKVTQQYAS